MILPVLGIDIAKLKFNVCLSTRAASSVTRSLPTRRLGSKNSTPGSSSKGRHTSMPVWKQPEHTARHSRSSPRSQPSRQCH